MRAKHKVRRRKGGTYPLSHLYGRFGLVRPTRLGHYVPWVKAGGLVREPDAEYLQVRFDERGEETGPRQAGLRRPPRKRRPSPPEAYRYRAPPRLYFSIRRRHQPLRDDVRSERHFSGKPALRKAIVRMLEKVSGVRKKNPLFLRGTRFSRGTRCEKTKRRAPKGSTMYCPRCHLPSRILCSFHPASAEWFPQ